MEEKIIEVAKALFIEKGYAETSMSEIAAKTIHYQAIIKPDRKQMMVSPYEFYVLFKSKVLSDIIISLLPNL